jgi:O-antigen/teichoic acid export membrane protein
MKLLGRNLIAPRYFDFSLVRSELGFSIVTYLIIIGNLLLYQTDQFIIGSVIGVAAIAMYQSAFKISELLIQFGRQMEGLISPAAARFHALNDSPALRDLFFRSSRLMFVLSTPLYLFAAFFLTDIIRVLTGLESVSRDVWLAGQFLLAAVYSNQMSSACARRVMIMTGREKMLLRFVLGSALLNLGLSVALGLKMGIAGVALATLVSNLLFGWGVLFPQVLRHLSCRFRNYFGFQWRGAVVGMAVFLALLVSTGILMPSGGEAGVFGLAWRAALIVLPALALNFRVIRSTWREEAL